MNIGKAPGKTMEMQFKSFADDSNTMQEIQISSMAHLKIPQFFNILEAHGMLLISLYCIKTSNFGIYIRFHTVDMEGGREGDNHCVLECLQCRRITFGQVVYYSC